VLTFIAPLQEGNYDFRMHNTDSSDGVEVASVSFTVQGSLLPQEASITLQKNVFAPGEEILVSFAAPPGFADNAWIGIIPSDVPHGGSPSTISTIFHICTFTRKLWENSSLRPHPRRVHTISECTTQTAATG